LEIRAVEELRRVERDTVIVGGLLPIRDNVWAGSGGGRGAEKAVDASLRIGETGDFRWFE
jgi:hypothetical protein